MGRFPVFTNESWGDRAWNGFSVAGVPALEKGNEMYQKPVLVQLGCIYDIKGGAWMNYDYGNDLHDQPDFR